MSPHDDIGGSCGGSHKGHCHWGTCVSPRTFRFLCLVLPGLCLRALRRGHLVLARAHVPVTAPREFRCGANLSHDQSPAAATARAEARASDSTTGSHLWPLAHYGWGLSNATRPASQLRLRDRSWTYRALVLWAFPVGASRSAASCISSSSSRHLSKLY